MRITPSLSGCKSFRYDMFKTLSSSHILDLVVLSVILALITTLVLTSELLMLSLTRVPICKHHYVEVKANVPGIKVGIACYHLKVFEWKHAQGTPHCALL